MDCSTPGFPVHQKLPEFTQTHVHWVGDAIQPSHPLSSPPPPAPNPSQHQGFFQWVNSSHEVAKVLEFQPQYQSFQWTTRTDPCKTKNQALSLWSGDTEFKTLDYQRTNPKGYKIVRTHTKETAWIQGPASPNHQQHPVQDASTKQQTKQKCKPSHQQTGLPPHSALPIRGKTNKQTKTSAQISPYMKLTKTDGPNLGGQKPKGRKSSTLKPGKRRPQTQ